MAPLDEYTTNNYLQQNNISSDYLRQLSGMFNPPPADQSQVNLPAEQPVAPVETTPTESYGPEETFVPETYDYGISETPQIDEGTLSELIRVFAPSMGQGSGELTQPTNMPTPTPQQKNKLLATSFVGGDFRISQEYGANKNSPLYKKLGGHEGVDIATPIGTEVRVPFNGVIEVVGDRKSTPNMSNYGNWVRVRDIETGNTYDLAHLSSVNVKPGKTIKAGDVIGKTGNTGKSTGPHLHISEWQNGKRVNPM